MAEITKSQLTEMLKSLIEDAMKPYAKSDDQLKELVEARLAEVRSETDTKIAAMVNHQKAADGEDPKEGFKSLSDFAIQVFKAGREGIPRTEELKTWHQKAAGSGLLEGSGGDGGFLIPTEFRNQLLEQGVQKSNIMQSAMTIPMATNSVKIPYVKDTDRSGGTVFGGVKFYWLDEVGDKTSSKPSLGQIELILKKCAGLCYASDEIIEDSPITLEPLLNRMFTDALGWTIDGVCLNGTGAGQPLGVINAPCLVSVAKETGQVAATIVYENVINMYGRLWRKSSGTWYCNDDTFTQLARMKLDVGTGGSAAYLPAGGLSGKPYDTLMGKPVIFTEHCQTVGTKGDILLADFSQYLIGQKAGVGIQFATSMHLKFDYDQTAFRVVFRIDGQPWWPAALTPRNSSSTVSPFVALATRA